MSFISMIQFILTLLIAHSAIAAVLPALQTAFTTTAGDAPPAVTSPASFPGLDHELKARQENPGYVCGFQNSNYSLTCNDHSLSCVGTILTDGDAYQYCSTPNAGTQYIFTTAYGYGAFSSCPSDALCCDSTAPQTIINLFVAGGYTVTGFGCDNSSTVVTWNPDVNLLNPASYSISLEQMTSTSSSSTSSPSPRTTSTSSSASASPTKNGGGGMPEGEKIGLGVGIGVGIFGLSLIGAAVYMLAPWIFRKKR